MFSLELDTSKKCHFYTKRLDILVLVMSWTQVRYLSVSQIQAVNFQLTSDYR